MSVFIVKAKAETRVHNCAHFESRQVAIAYGIVTLQQNPAAP
jgi:hypothetical protein